MPSAKKRAFIAYILTTALLATIFYTVYVILGFANWRSLHDVKKTEFSQICFRNALLVNLQMLCCIFYAFK